MSSADRLNARPKLAVWKFASCDGCQLSLLNCEDELLRLAEGGEIAHFDEASRRDPGHERTWIVLVDGNSQQIGAITAEATRRGVSSTILIDFVHVIPVN